MESDVVKIYLALVTIGTEVHDGSVVVAGICESPVLAQLMVLAIYQG